MKEAVKNIKLKKKKQEFSNVLGPYQNKWSYKLWHFKRKSEILSKAEVIIFQPLPSSAGSAGNLQQYQSYWQVVTGMSPADPKQLWIIPGVSLLSCCDILPQTQLPSIRD